MGRKKKKASKPWCWYCNREFDDEKILIQHQKAKHFKCHICHKKLYTGPGLSIHCMQVHKEAIDKVPNSLPNRANIDIEIYGMEGIPAEDVKEHEKQKTGGGKGSDSEDDEPAAKKKATPALLGPGPSGVTPGILPTPMGPVPPGMYPGAMPMNHMMGPMAPPFMSAGPRMMIPSMRPLFPAASVSASTPSKPTFPAYSSATISAPPTTSTAGNSDPKENGEVKPPAANSCPLVTATGAGSKIIHPPEDVSLEEIKARNAKYRPKPKPEVPQTPIAQPSQHIYTPSTSHAEVAAHMSAAVAAAARQQQAAATAAALRRPMMQSMMTGMIPQPMRVGVPVSVPPVVGVGMLPMMPQFNIMRPLQPATVQRGSARGGVTQIRVRVAGDCTAVTPAPPAVGLGAIPCRRLLARLHRGPWHFSSSSLAITVIVAYIFGYWAPRGAVNEYIKSMGGMSGMSGMSGMGGMGGMMPMGAMFPGGVPGLPMMQPRYR
ncbi:BUB3-interacting and GLEBS motif-containing protein ZNF207 [Eumeta japonica]|uniref:BUB3-interacting and GLEBS motif-containing protein ZNF207 n=1 Tax=Eumeta variegata TaxID=151549 RepID=A0A4C1ZZ05_EUMVA|nr:BUB3-interacting and GLEBS motif-containing protein ZNF207 [Eumeta japonica]